MLPWLVFMLSVLFAYLAFDAAPLVAPRDDELLPADMRSGLVEDPTSRAYRISHGLGDANHSVWLFAILSLGFGVSAFWALFQ